MQLETTIPLFPLGLVLLPHIPLPLHIFEERYKLMIGECLAENRDFGIVYFNATDIQAVGCTAKILKVIKRYDDGRLDILTRGQNRFLIKEMNDKKAYLEARVTFFDDEGQEDQRACQELADKGMDLMKQYASILQTQEGYGFAEGKYKLEGYVDWYMEWESHLCEYLAEHMKDEGDTDFVGRIKAEYPYLQEEEITECAVDLTVKFKEIN